MLKMKIFGGRHFMEYHAVVKPARQLIPSKILLLFISVETVNEHESICITGLDRRAGLATDTVIQNIQTESEFLREINSNTTISLSIRQNQFSKLNLLRSQESRIFAAKQRLHFS